MKACLPDSISERITDIQYNDNLTNQSKIMESLRTENRAMAKIN